LFYSLNFGSNFAVKSLLFLISNQTTAGRFLFENYASIFARMLETAFPFNPQLLVYLMQGFILPKVILAIFGSSFL